MKRKTVRFCDGCGHVFDDIQPEGGQGQWIEARVYLMKYGFHWEDLDRIDDVCPPCARVCQATERHPSAAGMKRHVSSRMRGAVQQERGVLVVTVSWARVSPISCWWKAPTHPLHRPGAA